MPGPFDALSISPQVLHSGKERSVVINKVILIGNLGQDPELRTTGGGTAVVNLRIATNERRKDRDGNWSDHTEWHTVVAFGRTAENVSQYCRRGRQLYVEGRLQTRDWTDRDGNERRSTEIVADNLRFLGGRDGEGANRDGGGGYRGGQQRQGEGRSGGYGPRDGGNPQPQNSSPPSQSNQDGQMPFEGDDIPF